MLFAASVFIKILIDLYCLNIKNMKKILTIIVLLTFVASGGWAQEFRGLDKSPLDMAYLPDNYAHDRKFAPERKLGTSAFIKVVYSRPQKKGREVFDVMVKYDELWRLGANETTDEAPYATTA